MFTAANKNLPHTAVHLGGVFVLLSVCVGGGLQKGMATEALIQILALPLILSTLMRFPDSRAAPGVNLFTVLLVLAMLVQMFPAFGLADRFFLVTVDGGRTLNSLALLAVIVSLFYWLSSLERRHQEIILRYLLAGVVLHLLQVFAQLWFPAFAVDTQHLPYEAKAGFFANRNHLAALFYASVPIVIGLSGRPGLFALSAICIVAFAAVQFAVGSRAGFALFSAGALAAYAVVNRSFAVRAGLAACGLAAAGFSLWHYGAELLALGDRTFERHLLARHTMAGILDRLPLGSGYGTFDLVYRQYEEITGIIYWEVAHAHNDYLELMLEGGAPAAALILGYLGLFGVRIARANLTRLQQCAACSIVLLLAHSLIDYPLRTMALAIMFAVLNAVFFADGASVRRSTNEKG